MLSLSSLLFLAITAAAHASIPTDSKFSLKSTFNPVESVLDLPVLRSSVSRSAKIHRRACDYHAIAVAHLTANIPYFAASDTMLTNLYTDPDSGATHVYYGQYYLPYSSDLLGFAGASVHIKSNCEVFTYTNALLDFTSFPQARSSTPVVSPENALKAVKDSGTNIDLDDFTADEHNGDVVFEGVKGVTQNVKAIKSIMPTTDGLRPVWRIETVTPGSHKFTYVSADTSEPEVLGSHDLVAHAKYLVYPFGTYGTNPTNSVRVLINNPQHGGASPLGWHNIPGDPASNATTWGNNVFAQEDWAAEDYVGTPTFSGPANIYPDNYRPAGGNNMSFIFPYDPNAPDPKTYINASVTQLFYTANMMHDFLEVLGWRGNSGNFEDYDMTTGAVDEDAVIAYSQMGAGGSDEYGTYLNNAYMYTPPEGWAERPRLAMFLFDNNLRLSWMDPEEPIPSPLAGAPQYRDSVFDQDIVIHEYTHGMTGRLVGGPANAFCIYGFPGSILNEAISDFFAVAIAHRPGKTSHSLAQWAAGTQLPNGMRKYPYSTSMAVNPVTLNQGDPGSSIHDWGTIYSSALYEVMHNLEAKWGHGAAVLPPLLRTSSIGIEVPSNGRQLAMKLVLESEKMWPCVPDFVTARDALLQADKLFTGGENFCEIWKGFAKRGLGTGTVWATSTEDFTVPEACT